MIRRSSRIATLNKSAKQQNPTSKESAKPQKSTPKASAKRKKSTSKASAKRRKPTLNNSLKRQKRKKATDYSSEQFKREITDFKHIPPTSIEEMQNGTTKCKRICTDILTFKRNRLEERKKLRGRYHSLTLKQKKAVKDYLKKATEFTLEELIIAERQNVLQAENKAQKIVDKMTLGQAKKILRKTCPRLSKVNFDKEMTEVKKILKNDNGIIRKTKEFKELACYKNKLATEEELACYQNILATEEELATEKELESYRIHDKPPLSNPSIPLGKETEI